MLYAFSKVFQIGVLPSRLPVQPHRWFTLSLLSLLKFFRKKYHWPGSTSRCVRDAAWKYVRDPEIRHLSYLSLLALFHLCRFPEYFTHKSNIFVVETRLDTSALQHPQQKLVKRRHANTCLPSHHATIFHEPRPNYAT
jgi:hypothetical protein